MKLIRAALGGDVQDAAGRAAILCGEGVPRGLELFDGFYADGVDERTSAAGRITVVRGNKVNRLEISTLTFPGGNPRRDP